ncbi:MAG: hypothetical protein ACU0GG_18535 [Paracoccaceae bacterium]
MTRHVFLESFDHGASQGPSNEAEARLLDAEKAKSYEAGYASGWDDAIASDKTARLHLEAEFERNIQNLAFTMAEAVTHVRNELGVLLTAITEQLLPKTATDVLCAHIHSELMQLGDDLTEVRLELVASPDCNPTVADMLKSDFSFEIDLVEDQSLSQGQVFLRLGQREIEIDLEPLTRAISGQLAAIRTDTKGKELRND